MSSLIGVPETMGGIPVKYIAAKPQSFSVEELVKDMEKRKAEEFQQKAKKDMAYMMNRKKYQEETLNRMDTRSITEINLDGKSAEEIKKILEKYFATSGVIGVSDPNIFTPLTKEQIIDLEKLPLQPLHMVYPDIISNELMSKIKDVIDKSVQELREKGYTDEEILNKLGKQQESYNKITGDIRYNEPKSEPETSYEDAEDVIQANQIYREAKERILRAQNHQVRYGLDKYPEALNPDSWDILETIDHAMDEMVDQMHYLQMLRIKLEERLVNMKEPEYLMSGADFDGDFAYSFKDGDPAMMEDSETVNPFKKDLEDK